MVLINPTDKRWSALVVGQGELPDSVCSVLRAAGYWPIVRSARSLTPDAELANEELVVVCCSGSSDQSDEIQQQRLAGNTQPIVIVGHESPCRSCDAALNGGADAWIPAPLLEVLLVRTVSSLVRRASGFWHRPCVGFEFEPDEHAVRCETARVRLRRREYTLMTYLACHAGQWVSERRILEEAFQLQTRFDTPLVRVHIRSLRKALGALGSCIESRRGSGYRFVPPKPSQPKMAGCSRPRARD